MSDGDDAERAIVAAISRRLGRRPVLLAGSRAAGTADPTSDWDVVVGLPWALIPLAGRRLDAARRELEAELGAPVTLSPVPTRWLRRQPRNLFLWKLAAEGRRLTPLAAPPVPPRPSPLPPAWRWSYAASALMYLLEAETAAEPKRSRLTAKADAHVGELGGELRSALADPPGDTFMRNVRYVVRAALAGRNRLSALLAQPAADVGLVRAASALLEHDVEGAVRALPRRLRRDAGSTWDSVQRVVLEEWPLAHPVLAQ